jgi:hypothetical protein
VLIVCPLQVQTVVVQPLSGPHVIDSRTAFWPQPGALYAENEQASWTCPSGWTFPSG